MRCSRLHDEAAERTVGKAKAGCGKAEGEVGGDLELITSRWGNSLDRFVDGFAARMAREAKPTCGTTWRLEIAVLELLRGVDGVV